MALVSVLWAIALLGVIAVSLGWNSTVSYRLAHNDREFATVNATVEAGVSRAILSLLDPRRERRWRVDGIAQMFEFNGRRMKISIQDELGRIDLNQADTSLLAGLLRSAGLAPQSADRLVDKVLDWRESAPFKRLNGAKEPDYRAAGSPYLPRGGPFQSVDEVLLVLGMTPDLFRRIEPALTVYSGRQFIDPRVAPREALLALPGMEADKVDGVIAARATQQSDIVPPIDEIPALQGRAFAIRAEIEHPSSGLTREAVIRLTGNPTQPFWVLTWRMR